MRGKGQTKDAENGFFAENEVYLGESLNLPDKTQERLYTKHLKQQSLLVQRLSQYA